MVFEQHVKKINGDSWYLQHARGQRGSMVMEKVWVWLEYTGRDSGRGGELEGRWTLFPQDAASSLTSSTSSGWAGELLEEFCRAVA